MLYDRKKLITLVTLLFVVVACVLGVLAFLNRDNGTMRLAIAPSEATLKYNKTQRSVEYDQVISLKQGTYDLSFERDGFKTVKQQVSISKGQEIVVYAYLEPQTDQAKKIMETGNNQLYKEQVVGHNIKEGGEKLTQQNPILKVLPILERNYTIEPCTLPEGYVGQGDDKEIAVCISALSDTAYAKALEDIKARGYNPDEYLITRKN